MYSFQSSHLISSSSSIVLCAGASHSTKPFLYPPAASILLASKISPLAVGLSPCWLCSASSCLAHFNLLHLRVVIRSNEGCLHSSDIEFPVMCAKHRAFHPLSVERSESSRHHDSNPCVITDTTAAPSAWLLGNILNPCTVDIGLGSSPRRGLLYVLALFLDLNSSESIERLSSTTFGSHVPDPP